MGSSSLYVHHLERHAVHAVEDPLLALSYPRRHALPYRSFVGPYEPLCDSCASFSIVFVTKARAFGALGGALQSSGGSRSAMAPRGSVLEDATNQEELIRTPGGSTKTVEETYQKKTQLEHILLRPDTYIGSVEKVQQTLWIFDGTKMVQKEVGYVPGLYKIFDEILVNAADNKVRDSKMDTLRVDIDQESNTVQVYNNGNGVPVTIHKEEGVYVPELIFGHLLTSSNYNDQEKKVTGGRNGYGAKLTNIFSTEFTIETCDGQRGLQYKQIFQNNMALKGEPSITKCKKTDNWTRVTFKPDLKKFNMEELEDDIVALMTKRVYDVAGCIGKGCKVYLNGEQLKIKKFSDYVDLFLNSQDVPKLHEKVNDRWEICVSVSDGQFQQCSFVNSINTLRGGTHVNYIADQVSAKILEHMKKKHKNTKIKQFQIKNHLWIFVNSLIENPAFDSQTKETLTTRATAFGSKCDISDEFMKKVFKCGVIDNILAWATFKESKELKKTDGSKRSRLVGIPKLDDANDAGTRNSQHCTLILTEGDSAKALAISGLSVVGRDRFGVFPLRGKLLNVRDASHQQIMSNTEISNIKQILGLQHGKEYTDTKSLRYGHLMIMTDQDHDGSHIKGLLINFLHAHFASLLKVPGFLVEFITPIIKAKKGKQTMTFYSMPEYQNWLESLGEDRTKGWSIKYYKGLGTSTAAEAKQYFADIENHRKVFTWDGEEAGQLIEMAFSKKKVEERKGWMRKHKPGTFLDHSESSVSYSNFINQELILFSLADLQRSIPSVCDGMKTGQRKIIYCAFKRNLKSDIKVAQLAGYVSEHSAYHHGEQSLTSTIVGLAQSFVGSNNINLLYPSGQFGTRLQGGKDAASPRYIFTRLGPLARLLFPEPDDQLLEYLYEEGQQIEPEHYLPIMPTVLINGAEGIGTGWSTSVPNYNPRDIVENIKCLLNGEDMYEMMPWYKGFTGSIVKNPAKKNGESGYTVKGCITQIDDTTLEITELPIRKWTQDYKEFLETLVKPENKNEQPFITDYKEYHTDTTVHFVVTLPADKMQEALAVGLDKKFKLTTTVSTSNMHLFNADGLITKYASAEEILSDFYGMRLELYEKRKAYLLASMEQDMLRLDNKVRFILAVVSGNLIINNRKKADIEAELESQGYDKMRKRSKGKKQEEDDDDVSSSKALQASYDYLLSMPLWSLTMEKVSELCGERDKHAEDLEVLRATSPKEMWNQDLDAFLTELDKLEVEEESDARKLASQRNTAKRQQQKQSKKQKTKQKKANPWSDEESDESGVEDTNHARINKPKQPVTAAPRQRVAYKKNAGTVSMSVTEDDTATLATAATAEDEEPTTRRRIAPAVPKPIMSVDSDTEEDDNDIGLSLLERLQKKQGKVSDEASKPSTSSLTSKMAKVAVGKGSKKVAAQSKRTTSNGTEPSSPAPGKPAEKIRKTRTSPFNKKSGLSKGTPESSEEEEVLSPAQRRQAPARAKKPQQKIYDISSEEEEDDDDFDLEEEEDEEDSDFEV